LLFDAHKLDISDEFQEVIEAVKEEDSKVRLDYSSSPSSSASSSSFLLFLLHPPQPLHPLPFLPPQ